MRVSEAFPSNYLRAADLQGRDVTVTIDRVAMEDIGDDHKPVVYFVGKEKGLVLNKTNANNISLQHGDDTDKWTGKPITMFPTQVDFQGRSVEAIRVRLRAGNGVTKSAAPHPAAVGAPVVDDSIPF